MNPKLGLEIQRSQTERLHQRPEVARLGGAVDQCRHGGLKRLERGRDAGRTVLQCGERKQRKLRHDAQRRLLGRGRHGGLHRRLQEEVSGLGIATVQKVLAHRGAFGSAPKPRSAIAEAFVAASVVVVKPQSRSGTEAGKARSQRGVAVGAQPGLFDQQQRPFRKAHAVQAGVERYWTVPEQEVGCRLVIGPQVGVAELDVAAGRLAAAPPEVVAERVDWAVGIPLRDPRLVASLSIRVDVRDNAEGELLPQILQPPTLGAPAPGRQPFDDERPQRLGADGLVGVGASYQRDQSRAVAHRDARDGSPLFALADGLERREVRILLARGAQRLEDLGRGLEPRVGQVEVNEPHAVRAAKAWAHWTAQATAPSMWAGVGPPSMSW